jgi:hypothetical protein
MARQVLWHNEWLLHCPSPADPLRSTDAGYAFTAVGAAT